MYQLSKETLENGDFGLIAMIKGIDETVSQTIHANHMYGYQDIQWGYRFVDMHIKNRDTGETTVDMSVINDTIPA